MSVLLIAFAVAVAASISLVFSALNSALRHYSRTTFAEVLGRRNADHWFEPTIDHTDDLIFVSAVMRLLGNLLIWLILFIAFDDAGRSAAYRFDLPLLIGGPIMLIASVALPTLLVRHAAEAMIAVFCPVLHALRFLLRPLTGLLAALDRAVGRVQRAVGVLAEVGVAGRVEEVHLEAVVGELEDARRDRGNLRIPESGNGRRVRAIP